jgi:hypothetical protein
LAKYLPERKYLEQRLIQENLAKYLPERKKYLEQRLI